ncbi:MULTISPECIES: type II toxin-antitoxin system HicB family antitoxin [Xanthomonas]|uniref:type II toxin-antitoxin system HicB family antitoxin n=1 Tax=Xanthomonas TaxID=338 RepID=UPI000C080936|nr:MULTISPECIES: type II toxin-antitoxin system HicB family antitoxin [Xanthomonas]MBO9741455.1 type II toxin-antitoxin system HicB family antitoxin [Xanthomonas axonopodis pv. begoniae]MEE5092682.1 type II toxin-antitoxin system HicB family antitoxin [Xanthomonas euvesicatoria]MCC8471522.1 type II toxin-antitoxin system HicB family antitoxin [Xanthomonas phaseoli]PPT31008.1 antitoxin [Xanthomonas axonopodis pv. begoniae]RTE55608.1 type II toxin-antitoxin system HicB family antitoxin [Xanthomo
MKFPARIEGTQGDFVLTFRDIPEAITGGATVEEVQALALDCLVTAMDFYFDDRRLVPAPSTPVEDEFLVSLPVSIATKALLLNRMIETKTTPAELARRLGTTPQTVNRLVNLHHTTKIDTLADAIQALGADLEVGISAAA